MSDRLKTVEITSSSVGHVGHVVRALVQTGWFPTRCPAGGRLVRNKQLIVLKSSNQTISLRLLVYKVTRSGRGRDHERRVEITSTYGHGLEPETGFNDAVLGY